MTNQNNAAQAAENDEVQRIKDRGPAYPHTPDAAPPTPLSKLRAPVAESTDRAMLQSVLQDLEKSESVCPRCGHSDSCADMDVAHMIRDHLKGDASAPVAGEAQPSDAEVLKVYAETVAEYADGRGFEAGTVAFARSLLRRYAAPQASAQNVRNADAAMAAEYQQWIDWFHKGRDYDSFLKECVFNKPQADKDGSQQRAGDECKHARAYRAGDRQGYACPDCGEFVSDYEIHRRQRAALSAPQAEQGERDA